MEESQIAKEVNKLRLITFFGIIGIIAILFALLIATINRNALLTYSADEISTKVTAIMASFCLALSFLIEYDKDSQITNFSKTYKNRIYARCLGFSFGMLSYLLSNDLSILFSLGLLTILLLIFDLPSKKKALKFAV